MCRDLVIDIMDILLLISIPSVFNAAHTEANICDRLSSERADHKRAEIDNKYIANSLQTVARRANKKLRIRAPILRGQRATF